MRTGLWRNVAAVLFALVTISSSNISSQSSPASSSGSATPQPAASNAAPGDSSSAASAGAGTTAVDAGQTKSVGGGVSAPVLIKQVDPHFSEEARQQHTGGTVTVNMIVDQKGMPQNVRVIRGVGMGLDENAVKAVRQYRFKPAMEKGKPVAVYLNVEVQFDYFENAEEMKAAGYGPPSNPADRAHYDAELGAPAPSNAAPASSSSGAQAAGLSAKLAIPGCKADHAQPSEADTALLAHRYADAERLYGVALAADPTSSIAMAGLVRTSQAEGKLPEALSLAMKFSSAHPNDAVLLDALGEVRFRRGETDEAAMAFNQSSRLDHCNGLTHYDMARFLNLSGMYASGQQQLELAHTLLPENQEIAARWNASHAIPLTASESLATLKTQLDNPALSDAQKTGIDTAIKNIENSQMGSCELVSPVAEVKVPIIALTTSSVPVQAYAAAMEVQFNGKKRRLEIDTGASGMVVTNSVAKAAGLVPELETKAYGIGDKGPASSFVTHVDDIKIGSMEFKNCKVHVLEPGNQLEKMRDIDGLIGTDVFRDYLVTLDFPGRAMLLGPLPRRPGESEPKATSLASQGVEQTSGSIADNAKDRYVAPEMKDWTPVFRSGHSLFVPTYIGNAPAKLFLIDTGSNHSVISLDAAREVTVLSGLNGPTVKGLNGEVLKTQVASEVPLGFAGVRQIVSGMTSIDTSSLSRSVGVDISGFIGFITLRELVLSIDYRDNLIHVVYDPKKGYHTLSPY